MPSTDVSRAPAGLAERTRLMAMRPRLIDEVQ
jgi:hypothetical protein